MQEFITSEIAAAFAPAYYWTTRAAPNCEVELFRRVFFYQMFSPHIHTNINAAARGHLHVIRFLRRYVPGEFQLHICLQMAAAKGHVHILRHFHEVVCVFAGMYVRAAAEARQYEALCYLAKCNINAAFREACHFGWTSMMHELLEKGADPRADNNAALCWAAFRNHMDIVRFLVEEHGADVTAMDNDCIRFACRNGYMELVLYLLARGADVRVNRDEPFRRALSARQYKIVVLFLRMIPELASLHQSLLREAFLTGDKNLMRALVPYMDAHAAFDGVCMVGTLRFLRSLPVPRTIGHTCLVAAAERGHLDIMRYLVENGAKLRGVYEMRLMHAAAERGHCNMVRYLAAAGISLQNIWKSAVKSENKYLLIYLLGRGAADVNHVVAYAARCAHLPIVKEFMSSVTHRVHVFCAACTGGDINAVQFMVKYGLPDPAITAGFKIAAKEKHMNVVRYLVDTFGKQYFTDAAQMVHVEDDLRMLLYVNTIRSYASRET